MKERPMLMKGPLVRRSMDGRKTMTRRIVTHPRVFGVDDLVSAYPDGAGTGFIFWTHDNNGLAEFTKKAYPGEHGIPCPHGSAGDTLWIRETWCNAADQDLMGQAYDGQDNFRYRANEAPSDYTWRPAIFMPREACRLHLEVIGIRVERLHSITDDDIRAEGVSDLTVDDLMEMGSSLRHDHRHRTHRP